MNNLVYFFPFLFIGMFILVCYTLSKKGWSDLAAKYLYDDEFEGERVGIISAAINGVNYQNCLVLRFNNEGFYLRPILIFRLFQKPLFIPWKEIKDIRDKKILFFEFKELVIGAPAIAIMQIKNSTFTAMREYPYTQSSNIHNKHREEV